jgi:hypothetical protein
VRVKFGHRERDSLWGMVGINCLVWEAFVEFMYVAIHILM